MRARQRTAANSLERPQDSSSSSFHSYAGPLDGWPQAPAAPADSAFNGPAGDFVRLVEPHTEADPVAILVQCLVGFGSLVGRGPYFTAEADRHHTRLFATLVGPTAKARKGVAWGHARSLLAHLDPAWVQRIQVGLSSGEGLIHAVRDAGAVLASGKQTQDGGVEDKRLLIVESEFASTLRVLGREGNTLSAVLREAWDGGTLSTLTKNSPAKATDAHISVIGHITVEELRRYLDRTEAGNGFANRFLWVFVQRSKLLPEGGRLDTIDLKAINRRFKKALAFARALGEAELKRTEQARDRWISEYRRLSEGRPGLLGAVTSRAEAQVMRLALTYAVLDCSKTIKRQHLKAALALWAYCDASARFIFGASLGDPVADELLRILRWSSEPLTRTRINEAFSHNRSAAEIGRALALLHQSGLAIKEEANSRGQRGRPSERWVAARHDERNAVNERRRGHTV